jgi:hypothetical protein
MNENYHRSTPSTPACPSCGTTATARPAFPVAVRDLVSGNAWLVVPGADPDELEEAIAEITLTTLEELEGKTGRNTGE